MSLHFEFLAILIFSKDYLTASASTTPNMIFILADDLGWNDVGYNHGSEILTPYIDNLAYTGLILNQYYAQKSCTPSRAAFLSGRYPCSIGMQHLLRDEATYGLPLKHKIISQQFKKYTNYTTHAIGKWHAGFYTWDYTPEHRGFDTFFGYYGGHESYYLHSRNGGYDWRNNTRPVCQCINSSLCNEKFECTADFLNDDAYSTYLFGNETIRILKQHQNNLINNMCGNYGNNNINNSNDIDSNINWDPFFIYLPFQSVHTPLQAPESSVDRYNFIDNSKRKMKAAMTSIMDDVIGQIVTVLKQSINLPCTRAHAHDRDETTMDDHSYDNDSALKSRHNLSLWDDTLVIFSSDNGAPVFMQGGQKTKTSKYDGGSNWPLRAGKTMLFEGSMRVPCVINGGILPNHKRGKVSNDLIHITDWYPTFANIAGFGCMVDSQSTLFNNWNNINYNSDDIDSNYNNNGNIVDGYDISSIIFDINGTSDRDIILHDIETFNFEKHVGNNSDKFEMFAGALRYKQYKLIVGAKRVDGLWDIPSNVNFNYNYNYTFNGIKFNYLNNNTVYMNHTTINKDNDTSKISKLKMQPRINCGYIGMQ